MADEDRSLEWARDEVVTILRRRFPEPLAGHELQAESGLGAEDLRAVLDELREDRWLEDGDHGFVLSEMGYDPEAAQPIGQGPPVPVEDDGELEEGEVPPEPVEAAETAAETPPPLPTQGVTVGETRYAAMIGAEIAYYPEQLDGEDADMAALREARAMEDAVRTALYDRWPDLPITTRIVSLEAFDKPRRVI